MPFNPTGLLIAPLGLMAMYYGSRKSKKSAPYVMMLVLMVILPVSIGLACATATPAPATPTPTAPEVSPAPITTPVPVTEPAVTPPSAEPPVTTPTEPDPCINCPTPSSTPSPTNTPALTELRDIYGVILENGNMEWSSAQISVTLTAIKDIANRFGSVSAFRLKFNISDSSPIRIIMGTSTSYNPEIINDDCRIIPGGGCTSTNKVINFASLLPNGGNPETRSKTARNNVVHEMGHVFSNEHGNIPETELRAHPAGFVDNRNLILMDNSSVQWQLNPTRNARETFGDFFVAWTYNEWRPLIDDNGITKAGIAKAWMDDNMSNNW